MIQEETLDGHVLNGIHRITGAIARGWIREVHRIFALALQGEPLGYLYNVRQALPEGYQDPYVEGWDDEQLEEKEEEVVEEEEESEQVSDEEDDSQDGEMGAMLAPAPLHVKVERKYSPPRNRSGRVRR